MGCLSMVVFWQSESMESAVCESQTAKVWTCLSPTCARSCLDTLQWPTDPHEQWVLHASTWSLRTLHRQQRPTVWLWVPKWKHLANQSQSPRTCTKWALNSLTTPLCLDLWASVFCQGLPSCLQEAQLPLSRLRRSHARTSMMSSRLCSPMHQSGTMAIGILSLPLYPGTPGKLMESIDTLSVLSQLHGTPSPCNPSPKRFWHCRVSAMALWCSWESLSKHSVSSNRECLLNLHSCPRISLGRDTHSLCRTSTSSFLFFTLASNQGSQKFWTHQLKGLEKLDCYTCGHARLRDKGRLQRLVSVLSPSFSIQDSCLNSLCARVMHVTDLKF